MSPQLNILIMGALAMSSGVASALFLRFWRASRDRLFLFFAFAFATLAINWAGLGLFHWQSEVRHHWFILRLSAFLLILTGIADKNRRARRDRPGR